MVRNQTCSSQYVQLKADVAGSDPENTFTQFIPVDILHLGENNLIQ